MATFDWHGLLTEWSRAVLADDELSASLPPEVVASGWLGYPGATEEELATAEDRLGVSLPPSYRAFLSLTNGWRTVDLFVQQLWSTEEIEWLAVLDQDGIDAWRMGEEPMGRVPPVPDAEYFAYDKNGKATNELALRSDYLQTALRISDVEYGGTGVYLLNPRVVTQDGEWEAWFWAHWIPGAYRYRSFWDMLRDESARR